jgi:putative transposon-encoded protein
MSQSVSRRRRGHGVLWALLLSLLPLLALGAPWQLSASAAGSPDPSAAAPLVPARIFAPPRGFDPLTASAPELASYGYPRRPTDPQQLGAWQNAMLHATTFVQPRFTPAKFMRNAVAGTSDTSISDSIPTGDCNSYATIPTTPAGGCDSGNWSGQVMGYDSFPASDGPVTYAAADWVQPAVPANAKFPCSATQTCTWPSVQNVVSDTPNATPWVGMGGLGGLPLIQAGCNSFATTPPTYWCWWEDVGSSASIDNDGGAVFVDFSPSPGDEMYMAVFYNGQTDSACPNGGNSSFWMQDVTTGAVVTPFTVCTTAYSGVSGDFIVESAGSTSILGVPVPDYGSVPMSGCIVGTGGVSYPTADLTLSSSNATAEYMAQPSGPIESAPGSVSSGSFTTYWVGPPSATTGSTTNVSSTGATLKGVVSDGGFGVVGEGSTNSDFNLNTSPTGTGETPVSASPGPFTGSANETAAVTGLTPRTKYYFQVAAWNTAGTNYGSWVPFSTPALSAPSATTESATNVTQTTATLSGTVNDNGFGAAGKGTTSSDFNLNTSPTGTGETPVSASPGPFTGSANETAAVTGLTPSTTYYFQVAAWNAAGTNYGSWVPFTTGNESQVAVFRPSNGTWYFQAGGPTGSVADQFGQNGDIPVSGDYLGNGTTQVALFRPSNGTWYFQAGGPTGSVADQFGQNGDIPVPGDYLGNGKTQVAVFRPSNGTWYFQAGGPTGSVADQFGQNGDIPVPGDYLGNGTTQVALFRPSNGTWYFQALYPNAGWANQFGKSGDIPVPGDYLGNGTTQVAVFRPSNGTWYFQAGGPTGSVADQFGKNGDIPVPGGYLGNGTTQVALFRPSNGTWYFQALYPNAGWADKFGQNGDIPVPFLT